MYFRNTLDPFIAKIFAPADDFRRREKQHDAANEAEGRQHRRGRNQERIAAAKQSHGDDQEWTKFVKVAFVGRYLFIQVSPLKKTLHPL